MKKWLLPGCHIHEYTLKKKTSSCVYSERKVKQRSDSFLLVLLHWGWNPVELNHGSLWKPVLLLHLLICQPTYVLGDYSIFTHSLKILAGFSSLCAWRSKKKNAADEDSACTFPDVGLFLKAVGVSRAEQQRSLLAPFLPPPCTLRVQFLRSKFVNKDSINASSNYSIVDVLWVGGS